jgi:DNA-binding HxlR family transcriptional regulator
MAAELEHRHSAAEVIALVADKWVVAVLHALRAGHNRFGLMQRAMPAITKKMLTQTLRKLERNGILRRVADRDQAPRVEYFLTPAGEALVARLTQMCEWSKDHFAEVERARAQYDATSTGWV